MMHDQAPSGRLRICSRRQTKINRPVALFACRTIPHLLPHPIIMPFTTVISAPGKVLAAGGYLVLDPAHSGLVIATSARFYTAISVPAAPAPRTIRVRSPQFEAANWVYTVSEYGDVEQRCVGGRVTMVK